MKRKPSILLRCPTPNSHLFFHHRHSHSVSFLAPSLVLSPLLHFFLSCFAPPPPASNPPTHSPTQPHAHTPPKPHPHASEQRTDQGCGSRNSTHSTLQTRSIILTGPPSEASVTNERGMLFAMVQECATRVAVNTCAQVRMPRAMCEDTCIRRSTHFVAVSSRGVCNIRRCRKTQPQHLRYT